MEKKSKLKNALSVVGNVLLWIFVAFSLLITIMVFSSQNNKDGIPSLMGRTLVSVQTDSMKPAFSAGDLIIVEKVPLSETAGLQLQDVIIYRAPIDINGDGNLGDLNTHRIAENLPEQKAFVTKGDNNPLTDNQGDNPYTVPYVNVIGRYTGTRLPGVGHVMDFLQTSLGFFLCVVLPLILFFLYELYNFIAILVTERAKKAALTGSEISKDAEEEIKRKAIEEYLKNQSAAQPEETGSQEECPREAPEKDAPAAPEVPSHDGAEEISSDSSKEEDASPKEEASDSPKADPEEQTSPDSQNISEEKNS